MYLIKWFKEGEHYPIFQVANDEAQLDLKIADILADELMEDYEVYRVSSLSKFI